MAMSGQNYFITSFGAAHQVSQLGFCFRYGYTHQGSKLDHYMVIILA
jgi:hypothetical protein